MPSELVDHKVEGGVQVQVQVKVNDLLQR